MKIKFAFFISACMMLLATSAWAQKSETSIVKDISITEKSTEQSVTVEVEEGVSRLDINVFCRLTGGKIVVEVFNPEGKRKGRLTLGETNSTENTNETQKEDGKLKQEVEKPAKGMWIIKIVPTKCTASVRVSAIQLSIK